MGKIEVLIVMGSEKDMPVMEEAKKMLDEFGISNDTRIASAHRSPGKVMELASKAPGEGIRVIIAGAGMAAHLAGAIAANTTLPVIGVPLDSSSLKGFDALLATVQMPSGVPVGTMAIGKAGARNAAIFAAEILALSDGRLQKKLLDYKAGLTNH